MALPSSLDIDKYIAKVRSNNIETAGRKDDQDKPMAGLMCKDFSFALQEVAKVTSYGAKKYDPSNWLKVDNAEERYTDAMMRHFLCELAGNDVDEESGLINAAMTAWNALARLELILREKGCRTRCPASVD